MKKSKKGKVKLLKDFSYFYSIIGYRMIVSFLLNLLVGVLDGFGLALFMPVLSMFGSEGTVDTESMGTLSFVADFISFFNFELTLNVILIFILILFLFKGLIKYVEAYYSVVVAAFFVLRIRKLCVHHFSNYKYKAFINSDSGKIQNTLGAEVGRVAGAYHGYRSMLQNGVFVIVYVSLAFMSNPTFAVLIGLAGLLTNFIFYKIYKKTKKLSSEITVYGHMFQGLLLQSVGFFKYLKATGRSRGFSNKLIQVMEDMELNGKRMGKISAFIASVREPIIMLIVVGVILIQVNVFEQNMSLLILSLLFFWRALNSVMAVQIGWNGYLGVSGSLENMRGFIKDLENNAEVYGEKEFVKLESKLELIDFSFYYNKGSLILKKINLSIPKNTTVAFVGESGSGKTTLVNVLSGLMPIEEGAFEIDGTAIEKINTETFQNRIGYITQEPVVFTDDIFNNVTFWAEKTDENIAKFWRALEKASIDDFVKKLPNKENSSLGSNGVMVSGGQKQRISIARELYKDIDILIMDEATSALDSQTERAIQDNIDKLKGHYTILIVAHRLSTIKNADVIVLMKEGEILDQGSFSDLVERNAYFKKMVELQEL